MIARIKVLGMRAANGAALRVAARGIVSYLQGGAKDAKPTAKQSLNGDATAASEGERRSLAGAISYYVVSGSGHSQGRARGSGAAAMGLSGPVSAAELEAVLMGRHAATGEVLLSARGASGRTSGVSSEARPVARHGDPAELLSLAEAAFLIGVEPRYLRELAKNRPQTLFATPTGADGLDPRLARRMIEWLCRQPLTPPAKAYLLADKDPGSGQWRVTRREVERFMAERVVPETVMGYDLVCAAPKSVSLLWAVGDDRIRSDIAEAFDAAVDATVGYLEHHACQAMVAGRNRPADGFGVVSFVHDTSRANEAHLHTHNLIVNAVRVPLLDDDGGPQVDEHGAPQVVWRAPDGDILMRHVKTAGYLGAAELRHQLATRWGVEWGPVRSGVAELAAFPEELLHAFSTRHDQVGEEFAQMVASGFEPGAVTEAAAQRASRAPKMVLADDKVREFQLAKLAEIGWTAPAVRDLASGGRAVPTPAMDAENEVDELHQRLVGPAGLTERQSTFTPRDVVQAVSSWAGARLSATQIRELADAFVADPAVVLCGVADRRRAQQNLEPVFTTEAMLAVEDNLFALYREARTDHGQPPRAAVPDEVVSAAIAELSARMASETGDPSACLSDEQVALVRAVTTCGDGIRCAVGPAGTGKTEAMAAAVAAWQAVGYRVVGCANGGSQTEELGARLGVDAQVVRSWLTRLETAEDPRTVWAEDTVVVVDEATQVSTRDAAKLCRWAARTRAVLVFVGDPAQLSSVGAGGWFPRVVAGAGAPSLSTIYRQGGDDMAEVRAALDGLRSELPGRVRAAMGRLAQDGRIRVFDDADTLLGQVVDDWYRDRQTRLTTTGRAPKPSRMMAAHRREVDRLNDAARRLLACDGTLSGPELVVAGRRFRVGDEVITLTQAGHNLIPEGAARDRYIRTGTVGTVTAVHLDAHHPERQRLRVAFPGRGPVVVDWRYLTHDFGDGRSGGLAHAYAVTADRAQGSTMHAARAVATDSTSRAALYVMVSRGQREVCAYVTADRQLQARGDDEAWLPVLATPGGTLPSVVDRLERSRLERLANDVDPVAWAAQQLRRGRNLAEISAAARHAQADPQARGGGVAFIVARRAELAEESAVAAAAVAAPTPELVARLGGRPGAGENRRSWDAAVAAVAVYRARWSADAGPPGYGQGARWAIGYYPDHPGGHATPWQTQRDQAEALVRRWADGLEPTRAARFWAVVEHVPRQRSTAAIHALLAAGVEPATLSAALTERERDSAKAGAAILEHRVNGLLRAHRVDPAAYQLAQPLSQGDEWGRVHRLVDTAEIRSLSRRNVADLCAERRDLLTLVGGNAPSDTQAVDAELSALEAAHDQTAARLVGARRDLSGLLDRRLPRRQQVATTRQQITGLERRHANETLQIDLLRQRKAAAGDGVEERYALRERHDLLSAAIDLIVDDAMATALVHPTRYLTALLGPRPDDPTGSAGWDRRARKVEAWRHHHLGLAYGQPAAGPDAPPSDQALGPPADDPIEALTRRRILDSAQSTIDIGLSR